MDDYDEIIDLCRSFNRRPREAVLGPRTLPSIEGDRPGDDFNQRASWEDILAPHGWKKVGEVGDKSYWRRPGKEERGWSATTGYCRTEQSGDLLYVFSSNAHPLESEKAYSRFAVHAILNHQGDFSKAAEELREKGYGKQAPTIRFTKTTPPGNGQTIPPSREGNSGTDSNPLGVKLASQLERGDTEAQWLWHGYLCLNGITLFSALWKAGKTTLLAHLVKSLASNGLFCGLRVQACQVLYVTEEHESRWAERRDALGLQDPLRFIVRPFAQKPTMEQWIGFLNALQAYCQVHPVQLIVFDTLSNLWPVKDENDAAKVQEALMPLHAVGNNIAFLLVHHLRKNDGHEATGARGSGALPAFVDTLMELRRYNATDRKDTRRVLTGYGRYEETTDEMVIELQRDPLAYVAHGDKQQVAARSIEEVLLAAEGPMAVTEPGKTDRQIYDGWPPESSKPQWAAFRSVLIEGVEKTYWKMTPGKPGRGGYPALFWRPPAELVPNTTTYRGGMHSLAPAEGSPATPADVASAAAAEQDARLGEILLVLRQCGPCDLARIASLTNQNEEIVKQYLFILWEAKNVLREEQAGQFIYALTPKGSSND